MGVSSDGRVRLVLPAAADYSRVARATAAVLGRREGFSVREVNQLQLDVGEAIAGLVGDAVDGDRVEVVFTVEEGDVAFTTALLGQPV